jgi:hypothetical protein
MQLPIWAFLLVSVCAISGIAWMVRQMRPGAAPPMTADRALALFQAEFPKFCGHLAEMAVDGRAAIIVSDEGNVVGCTTLIGMRWTPHAIGAADVAGVSIEGTKTRLRFRDFAWPELTIAWPDAATAQIWAQRFATLRGPAHA